MDENLKLCVPSGATTQAQVYGKPKRKKKKKVTAVELLETIRKEQSQKKFSGKLERCVRDVKSNLRKKNKNMSADKIKSRAIAICRSQLGE